MPTITAGDALLKAAIDLKVTIEKTCFQDSGNQGSFKNVNGYFQNKSISRRRSNETSEGQHREGSSAKGKNEANETVQASEGTSQQRVVTPEPVPNLIPRTQPDSDTDDDTAETIVSYSESEDWETLDGPAQNTRSQTQARTITQECLMATI